MARDQFSEAEISMVTSLCGRKDFALNLLKEHHESRIKVQQLGLRPIGPGLNILIWSLRLYVLFMILVVVLNTIQTIQQ